MHAINRGIGTEGLGTVLAGLWGSGNGTNTFGENVGAIGVTKVRSSDFVILIMCVYLNRCLLSYALYYVLLLLVLQTEVIVGLYT